MKNKEAFDYEDIMFKNIDGFKDIFFNNKLSTGFLEYSKNEILALLLIYRRDNVNMTDISEYINAPLNTATGVITRLEKKRIVERRRDTEDKRVVKIYLTDEGKKQIKEQIDCICEYIKKIYLSLDSNEINTLIKVVNKIFSILKEDKSEITTEKKENKIRRIIIE